MRSAGPTSATRAARPPRRPRPPGGRQLRQRLLRRHPGHRRDPGRTGPPRRPGPGRAAGRSRSAAFACFGVAAVVGLALVALSQAWWLLLLGALAILAAWRYTGGDNPYGYRGLGEVYVFVFFGLLATLGTLYTQAGRLTWFGLAGAVGVGVLASAILVANNLRDIPTDAETGKRTLAVRLGDRRTRLLYAGLVGRRPTSRRLGDGRRRALGAARAAQRPRRGPGGSSPGPLRRRRAGAHPGAGRDRAARGRVCRPRHPRRRRGGRAAAEPPRVSGRSSAAASRRARTPSAPLDLGVLGDLVGARAPALARRASTRSAIWRE